MIFLNVEFFNWAFIVGHPLGKKSARPPAILHDWPQLTTNYDEYLALVLPRSAIKIKLYPVIRDQHDTIVFNQ